MTSAIFTAAQNKGRAQEGPDQVRSTVDIVTDTDVELPDAPSANVSTAETSQADVTQMNGLTTAYASGHVERDKPNAILGNPGGIEHISDRQSSVGHAASQEESGKWGHRDFTVIESIEPGIPPGFTEEYFTVNPGGGRSHIQEGVGDYMTTDYGNGPNTVDQSTANAAARKAARDAAYSQLLGGE